VAPAPKFNTLQQLRQDLRRTGSRAGLLTVHHGGSVVRLAFVDGWSAPDRLRTRGPRMTAAAAAAQTTSGRRLSAVCRYPCPRPPPPRPAAAATACRDRRLGAAGRRRGRRRRGGGGGAGRCRRSALATIQQARYMWSWPNKPVDLFTVGAVSRVQHATGRRHACSSPNVFIARIPSPS
jgi:hypothetical protein